MWGGGRRASKVRAAAGAQRGRGRQVWQCLLVCVCAFAWHVRGPAGARGPHARLSCLPDQAGPWTKHLSLSNFSGTCARRPIYSCDIDREYSLAELEDGASRRPATCRPRTRARARARCIAAQAPMHVCCAYACTAYNMDDATTSTLVSVLGTQTGPAPDAAWAISHPAGLYIH